MNELWYIWTINQQRYKRLRESLDNMVEIKDILYPTVVKDYSTKAGWKKKDVPLYSNYIFLRYDHTNHIHAKLEDCQWIKEYVGICSQQEIEDVKALTNKNYDELMAGETLQKGKTYKLSTGPFKDMLCTVVDINGEKLTVSVSLFGSDRLIKCSTNDIEL
ncbi:hypothetical protein LCGC14_1170830 [marine sediment metagenome]|uniref:NusG-like N-terminal domain-containing protein n=1 Tax=marine sediment metagenome TaxID=412755 RepID=A0A0F9P814_9ZZZZ